jgi:hypothetical protein
VRREAVKPWSRGAVEAWSRGAVEPWRRGAVDTQGLRSCVRRVNVTPGTTDRRMVPELPLNGPQTAPKTLHRRSSRIHTRIISVCTRLTATRRARRRGWRTSRVFRIVAAEAPGLRSAGLADDHT